MINLETLGWSPFFESGFKQFSKSGYSVGRVTEAHKNLYRILTENGELMGKMSGKMRHENIGGGDLPATGDWVVMQVRAEEAQATIQAILPRFSKFSRKVAGTASREQVLAANIDTAFLVTALNNDFNLRRMERYLAVARESGAEPVVLLNKADMVESEQVEDRVVEMRKAVGVVPVIAVSALTMQGMGGIDPYLNMGKTAVFLGSSGVGKSALINALLGSEEQKTGEIRPGDDKGRHTTVFQKMIILPGRGMVIDTPGLRELQLWEVESGLSDVFQDIEEIAGGCRFRDCSHENEPGCAVKKAIDEGVLEQARLDSFLGLQQELARTAGRKEFLEKKNEMEKNISKKKKEMEKNFPRK
jgi:ribosome biogenesis GTPase / thiamine phosphate phosphatase